jgi:hypothetical protein
MFWYVEKMEHNPVSDNGWGSGGKSTSQDVAFPWSPMTPEQFCTASCRNVCDENRSKQSVASLWQH